MLHLFFDQKYNVQNARQRPNCEAGGVKMPVALQFPAQYSHSHGKREETAR